MDESQELEREQETALLDRRRLAAALLLLLQKKGRSLSQQKADVQDLLGQLGRGIRDHVYLGRRESRRLSIRGLNRELRSVGYHGTVSWSAQRSEDADLSHSVIAGRGYLGMVLKRYENNTAGNVDDALGVAVRDSEKRLAVVTKTAVLGAFAEERFLAQDELLGENLIQVWNVSWCKRTCAECASLAHIWQPLGGHFPAGDPPLHPNCGCYPDLVPSSWSSRLSLAA